MVGPGETIFYFWYLSVYFADVYYLTLWDIYYEISLQISPLVWSFWISVVEIVQLDSVTNDSTGRLIFSHF